MDRLVADDGRPDYMAGRWAHDCFYIIDTCLQRPSWASQIQAVSAIQALGFESRRDEAEKFMANLLDNHFGTKRRYEEHRARYAARFGCMN